GIENLLKKEITSSKTIEEFKEKIKSKRYTYNKLSRMLLHILCNLKKEDIKDFNKITYIRILGMNQVGRTYLNQIKKKLQVPLISKIEREKPKLLEFEINTTKIYDLINNKDLVKKEFNKIIYIGEDYDKE
ncbi:MAG: nucleotidyltransferase family protein, partial [Bacilli bacterium]|nr:nucleotidyltransferase family protein [Bacilli bacterium]